MWVPWDALTPENDSVFTGYMEAAIGQNLSHITLLFGRFSVSKKKKSVYASR